MCLDSLLIALALQPGLCRSIRTLCRSRGLQAVRVPYRNEGLAAKGEAFIRLGRGLARRVVAEGVPRAGCVLGRWVLRGLPAAV